MCWPVPGSQIVGASKNVGASELMRLNAIWFVESSDFLVSGSSSLNKKPEDSGYENGANVERSVRKAST